MVSSVMFLYVVGGYIPLCTSVSNSDTSCYDIYKMDSGNMDRMTCTGEHIVYHCIPNEKDQEVEICVQWKWITPGYCPYYDSLSNAIKERRCSYYCLRRDDLKDICICSSNHADNISCQTECGNDFTSDKYIVCEEKQLSTVARRFTATLSATQKSVITYEKERNSSNSSGEERNYSGSYIGITCGILIPLILAAVVIFLLRKGSTEEKENNRDIEGHPNEIAPLFEGNEQDIKWNVAENNEDLDKTDVEKGKQETEGNESKETERSSPVEDIEGTLAKMNMEEAKKPSEREGNKDKYVEMHAEYKGVTNVSSESSSASSSNQTPEIVSKEEKKDLQNSKHMNVDSCGGEGNNGLVHENGNLERTQNKTIGGSSSDMSLRDENRKCCELVQNSDGETINRQTKLEGNDEDRSTMNEEGKGKDGSTKNEEGNTEVGSTKNKEGNEESGSTKKKEGNKEERSTENKEHDEENRSTNNVKGNGKDGSTENEEDDEENRSTNNVKGNEEDGSTKNEDTGVFDGTLESLKKKEDGLQQDGTDEFLDLLGCGTIQTTQKILLNVVKENVTNPQSYLENESEKEMVKEILPEDSKGFINEGLGSVPVSYAILRLSLKKEHQPKSGWGQGIKDTDTGLGDDVERLHKVYTLWKGIQSAGEVTVNEYVKLYEMLIDAFQRLGKREDYQEFVTGCENLQRKLWYMDKLKTIKRFLPNWSRGSGDSD